MGIKWHNSILTSYQSAILGLSPIIFCIYFTMKNVHVGLSRVYLTMKIVTTLNI